MEEKFLDKMVIVRSQEQEPIRVGIIEKWVSVGNSIFPMINFEGKKKLCVSGVLPYNARLAEMLSSMSPDEGRHLVDEIVKMIQTTGKPERKNVIHSNIKITNKLNGLLIAAKEQAELSLFRQRHGAILVRGNRVINKTFNSGEFSAFAERFNKDKRFFASRHAELNCILGISKKLTTGSIIVVVRINKENKFRNSYPCQMCQSVCAFVGIAKIIYTADENTINEIIF